MTLQEFFVWTGRNPTYLLFVYGLIPLTALLAWVFGRGEGHLSPWKYLYSVLVFSAVLPGIFAFTLNVYLFLFERKSIMEWDVLMQFLPIFAMIATLLLIRRNVSFAQIPGFQQLSGLFGMVMATFALMWILDRTRIYVISVIPFWQALCIFAALFLIIRMGWNRFLGSGQRPQI